MKRLLIICVMAVVVAAAGFGAGHYSMYLQAEPVLFQYMQNAQAWQHQAELWQYQAENSLLAAEFYKENAANNHHVAELLCELYSSQTEEVEKLKDGIHRLEEFINKELNGGQVNH